MLAILISSGRYNMFYMAKMTFRCFSMILHYCVESGEPWDHVVDALVEKSTPSVSQFLQHPRWKGTLSSRVEQFKSYSDLLYRMSS